MRSGSPRLHVVTSISVAEPPPRRAPGRWLSTFLYRHPRVRLLLLLALPVGWLGVVYLGSLLVLLLSAFWKADPFTAQLVREFTLDNFERILETPVYRDVTFRTVRMAALVTVTCVLLAFPLAYYMARVASPRTRGCTCRRSFAGRPRFSRTTGTGGLRPAAA